MNKLFKNIVALFIPSILFFFHLLIFREWFSGLSYFIIIYNLISIIFTRLNNKYNFSNVWVFPIGFWFPSIYFIILLQRPAYGDFAHLGTTFMLFTSIICNAIPFIISLIIAIYVSVKGKKTKKE